MDLAELLKLGVQYVLPNLIAGTGFIAIRYNWGIEKERERLKRRREMVDTRRRELLVSWDGTAHTVASDKMVGIGFGLRWPSVMRPGV